MSQRKIKITHPKFGESLVVPESLSVWQSRGWSAEGDKPIVAQPVILEENTEEVSNVGEEQ